MDQAKRLKELEKENSRLKRLLADAELDKAILREAASGNFRARRSGARPWRARLGFLYGVRHAGLSATEMPHPLRTCLQTPICFARPRHIFNDQDHTRRTVENESPHCRTASQGNRTTGDYRFRPK